MREIVYRLEKEDYKNWIHWNVMKNYSEKARKKTILVFAALVAAFVIGGAVVGKNLTSMIPTLILGIAGGGYVLRTTSVEGQEKMIWKRAGLEKLEKSGNYPVVHLQLKDAGLVMRVENQEMTKPYGYKEIVGIEEIERLFLMETTDKTWQFVAKSAFESREAMDEFLAFMNEKIEAAKEDPESYSQEAMAQEDAALTEGTEAAELPAEGEEASESGAVSEAAAEKDEDEVVIEHVDTSNMGKIGKMAHIMAAMAAADAAEASEEAEESAEVSEETAESAEASEETAESAAEVSEETAEPETEGSMTEAVEETAEAATAEEE